MGQKILKTFGKRWPSRNYNTKNREAGMAGEGSSKSSEEEIDDQEEEEK